MMEPEKARWQQEAGFGLRGPATQRPDGYAEFREEAYARNLTGDLGVPQLPPLRTKIVRNPGSERFHQLLQEIGDLHDRKQADYGVPGDPFANVRASERWGVPAWVGALIRLNDKVVRLQSYARTGKMANESAEDSLRDIAVYALIALVLLEEPPPGDVTWDSDEGL